MTTTKPSLEELARQIGLEDEFSTPTIPAEGRPQGVLLKADEDSEPLPLDNLNDYLETDLVASPDDFITKPAFYNTGVSKAALVGGVGLCLFLGGAWIFTAASPGGNRQQTVIAPEEETPEDPTLVALRRSQAAESKAKAKLALLQQSKAQKAAAETEQSKADGAATEADASEANGDTETSTVAIKPSPPPPPPPPPPPARITPAPAYNTVRPQPVALSPAPSPPSHLGSGFSQRVISTAASPAVDPMAEWQRLANAGHYGQVERSQENPQFSDGADANATVAALFPGSEVWRNQVVETAVDVEVEAGSSGFGHATTAAPLSDYFERSSSPQAQLATHWRSQPRAVPHQRRSQPKPLSDSEPALESSIRPDGIEAENLGFIAQEIAQQTSEHSEERTILVGSSGQGHLVTPVIWAPDGSRGEARFIVNLSQPILDAQGQPALPADTQFVVAAQKLDPDSGLVDLTVTALLINGREYEAPEGVFAVRDRQGGLLLGQLMNQPNQGRGDTVRVLTGALTQVGKLMNRPRSTSTSSTNGQFGSSQSSTTQNNDPNYVGAVLEGGFEEFSTVMEERQAAAAAALAKAPQLYQLKANHPIQIFVNQSLSL